MEKRVENFRDFALASNLNVGNVVFVLTRCWSGVTVGDRVAVLRCARSMDIVGKWVVEDRRFTHSTEHWPTNVNAIVDVFPVLSSRGKYNGKYRQKCFKYQLITDMLGVAYSGPHVGSQHDAAIWHETKGLLQRHYENEAILGDLAYIGINHVLTKSKSGMCRHDCPLQRRRYSKKDWRTLSKKARKRCNTLCPTCRFFNKFVDRVRGRIEHTNARLKAFSLLRRCSSARLIRACVPIVIEYVAWLMCNKTTYRDAGLGIETDVGGICGCHFGKVERYVHPCAPLLREHVKNNIICVSSLPPQHAKKGTPTRHYTNPDYNDDEQLSPSESSTCSTEPLFSEWRFPWENS